MSDDYNSYVQGRADGMQQVRDENRTRIAALQVQLDEATGLLRAALNVFEAKGMDILPSKTVTNGICAFLARHAKEPTHV